MKTSFSLLGQTLLLHMIPAVGGALLGSLIALLFFIFIQFGIQNIGGNTFIVSGFIVFGITFLAVLFSNLLATVFLALSTKEKFKGKFRSAIQQIFFWNTGIMAASSPFFLFFPPEIGFSLAKFLIPFSAISSTLLYEVFAHPENPILAAHKSIVSGVMVAFVLFLLFLRPIPSEVMAFFFLPAVWLIIPLSSLGVNQAHLFILKK